jgi:biopolymer transport protein ExbD
MADINPSNNRSSSNSKRHGIKIDMTPLVDLAFLLLTFFILTRTFQEHHVLEVQWPDKPTSQTQGEPVSAKNVLNLIIGEDNKIYWWMEDQPNAKVTDLSKNGLRQLLITKRESNPKIVLLIKPKDISKYSNLVDVMDEVTILGMERYVLMDFGPNDEKVIHESLLAESPN